ncbi:MAG: hypothetical protein J5379_05300, partial [Clostridiales bacterium]|nr:hypothetical protein [Clostridiales bacterium]
MKKKIISYLISLIIIISCITPAYVFADNESEDPSESAIEDVSSDTVDVPGEDALGDTAQYIAYNLHYSLNNDGIHIVGHEEYEERGIYEEVTSGFYTEMICLCS